MSKFKAVESRIYRDGVFFLFCGDEEECQDLAEMFNQETAPLLDELATKDAVIEAQSERIKELERALKQIDFICGNGTNTRIPKIEKLIMELQLEESEDDNG